LRALARTDFAANSRLVKALVALRARTARECLEFMGDSVFSTMFVDLVEEAVILRYCGKKTGRGGPPSPGSALVCSLVRMGATALQNSPQVLVKRYSTEVEGDVEDCR
jgi:hypothetical protein